MLKSPVEKLLSHRFRGYAPVEHTFSGFENASASKVRHFEVDTRASKDGVLYVYHDPAIQGHLIADTESAVIDGLKIYNDEPVPRLEALLKLFREKFAEGTHLSLDIKDIGFEKEHMELISEYGLGDRVNIVSWCAKALMNFHRLGSGCPMFLSHQSLFAYGISGRITEFFAKNKIKIKKRTVLTGKNLFDSVPSELYRGYAHSLRCRTLPAELLQAIQESGGGVCVAKNLVCPSLLKYCEESKLKLWIYSVNEINAYRKFAAMDGIEIIFSDKAEYILSGIEQVIPQTAGPKPPIGIQPVT